MSRVALALSLALCTAALTTPGRADACGNSVRKVVDRTQESVQKAELFVAKRQYKKAVDALREVYGDELLVLSVRGTPYFGVLRDRAQRILALAVARSGGGIPIGMDLGGPTRSRKDAAVAWAVHTLRLHAAGDPLPARKAELAEALALQASGRPEAYTLLKELEDGDLMPGAEAWALFAELSKERGDLEGMKRAVQRCRQIRAPGVKCDVAAKS